MKNRPIPKRVTRKRLTKAEKQTRADFAAREEQTRNWFSDMSNRAIALRSKDREFHGLEREFRYFQADMLSDYERSKDVKHPRDLGMAREQILRSFLVDSGLLPARYAASSKSVRAASTTGHVSGELDMLFYDGAESITLMRRKDAFDVLPVENTYGVVQVKSKVSRSDIRDGLKNIASYKRLKRMPGSNEILSIGKPKTQHGFGILFAYDTDLDWNDIIDEIRAFANGNPQNVWANAIFVLSKGFFMHGDTDRAAYLSEQIQQIKSLEIHGRPDREGYCLYNFYSLLLAMLNNTQTQAIPIQEYFRLPLVAGDHSYSYALGQFAEYGTCSIHGDFARKLTEEKLIEVIEWCKSADPINWIRAVDIAYGKAGDDVAAYARQPGDVRIYNPDALPLSEILLIDSTMTHQGTERTTRSLAFDSINTAGMQIWIPYVYETKRGIINSCPRCEKSGVR